MTLYDYRAWRVHFRIARFFPAIPTEFPTNVTMQVSHGDPEEEVQEATGKPPGGRTSIEQKPYPFAVTCKADDSAAIEPQADRVPLAQ